MSRRSDSKHWRSEPAQPCSTEWRRWWFEESCCCDHSSSCWLLPSHCTVNVFVRRPNHSDVSHKTSLLNCLHSTFTLELNQIPNYSVIFKGMYVCIYLFWAHSTMYDRKDRDLRRDGKKKSRIGLNWLNVKLTSCYPVTRSCDIEKDCIWPQRLLTKKQEEEKKILQYRPSTVKLILRIRIRIEWHDKGIYTQLRETAW